MKVILIADFTINNLSGYLKNDLLHLPIQTSIAPFNQVHQVLIDSSLECWSEKQEFAIAWTQPERVLKSFASFINNEPIEIEVILAEVETFAQLLIKASERVETFFAVNWTIDLTLNYKGIVNTKSNHGIVDVVAKMNSLLASVLNNYPSMYVLDSTKWIAAAGKMAYSPKLWYLSKTPFHATVFAQASKDISSFIKNLRGIAKKVIITDLDNTLWGGVVGDIGSENLTLGGHNPLGEAFRDFQLAIKSIVNRGVVVAIASKNEEAVAMNAIENHPEMVLRKKDFVAWRINWDDKAKNILEIAQELNVGLDAILFLDDNPFERERVRHALPDVLVPDLPSDPMLYKHFLLQLDCFNSISSTSEDLKRTEYYALEKQRQESKSDFSSVDDWLQSIDIKVKCEKLNDANLQRILQLLNKTNQMNLQTRRYSEVDLVNRSVENNQHFFSFKVKDNFGDAGLTGVIGLEIKNEVLYVTDFVLSCRVIGRKIEETMLSVAIDYAIENGCKSVIAQYKESEKNKPCLDFFKTSGWKMNTNDFQWNVSQEFIRPYYVELEMDERQ